MPALQRRDGIVSIEPYGVFFQMQESLLRGEVTCIHTLAGLVKVLGRTDFTVVQLQAIFQNNREDFEALASLLYEAQAGETMLIAPSGQEAP